MPPRKHVRVGDAAPTDKVLRTVARKSAKQKLKKTGKVSLFLQMPTDVFEEVTKQLSTEDLLQLARIS